MADTLESLEIQVRHSASGAATEINQVAQAVQSLGRALESALPNLRSFNELLGRRRINVTNNDIGQLTQNFNNVNRAAQGARSATSSVASGFRNLTKSANKAKNPLETIVSSFKRIAFYRIIRAIIKEITQAFAEGLKNAYAFSQGITTETHRFAVAMDSMSSAGLKMKNQLGSAFIGLLAAIAPIVNQIIALVTRLANALSQIFAAFTGKTYLKAADVPKKWGEAAGGAAKAAKEWKNQLLGFDEINRLEDQPDSGGGGGGGEIDPSSMFEEANIDTPIKKFVDDLKAAIGAGDWSGAGKLLGDKVNSIVDAIPWARIGSKLGYGLNGAVQTLYYTLHTIDFTKIGADVAKFINNALANIDFHYWGRTIVRRFTSSVDFLIGALKTMNWKLVGDSVGDLIRGALSEANEWLTATDWESVGTALWQGIKDTIEGLDVGSIASGLSEFLANAITALATLVVSIDWADVVQTLIDALTTFLDNFDVAGVAKALAGIIDASIILIPSLVLGALQVAADLLARLFKAVGLDTIAGFFEGCVEKLKNIGQWLKENIVDPFVNNIKQLLGISSPSTVMAEIGGYIIAGLELGMAKAFGALITAVTTLWDNIKTAITNKWNEVVEAVSAKIEGLKLKFDGLKESIEEKVNSIKEFFGSLQQKWHEKVGMIKDKAEELRSWFQEKIDAVKEKLEEWRTKASEVTDAIGGFFSNAMITIGSIVNGILRAIDSIVAACQRARDTIASLGTVSVGGHKMSIAQSFGYEIEADGGFVDEGQMFVAREAGPELVGTIGNRTAVANNDQIVQAVSTGVASAVSAVLGSRSSGNNRPIVLNINGREFARATYADQQAVAREHGSRLVVNGVGA